MKTEDEIKERIKVLETLVENPSSKEREIAYENRIIALEWVLNN